jgi:hypothetical protein
VAITGTQAVDSKWIASELPKFAKNTVKYELYNASTGKLCGSALIPICTPLAKKVSFSNVKLGTAPASGKYFIKVSTTVKSVTVSGIGTVKSFDFKVV